MQRYNATSDRTVTLAALPPLLRDEPGLTRALGDPTARLAVVEVARPISIAALAHAVVTPAARRRVPDRHDGGPALRRPRTVPAATGEVVLFPAWETLPFERVSPSVETMGQRLDVLWRLRDPQRCPQIDRRRRPRPPAEARPRAPRRSNRSSCDPAAMIDPDELADHLVEFGYRREELVEHRGEFARRGAIVDVYPSTADAPIRIDLWGDEVDRLTTIRVNDQRRTDDLAEVRDLPGPRADPDRRRARPRGAGLVASRAVGP